MFDISKAAGQFFSTKLGKVEIQKLLGKGKSGYSYLVAANGSKYVLKLMHYEPCPYYSFGESNKVTLEALAFNELYSLGVPVPKLYACDETKNYLLKEFIDGPTATEVIIRGDVQDSMINQLFSVYKTVKKNNINIDYFPNNFVISHGKLVYIDYEFNQYMPEWDLPNWGLYYWANSEGMAKYLETTDANYINESGESGKPLKLPFEDQVKRWIVQFG